MKEGFKRMVSGAGRYLLIMILIPMLSGCAGQGKSEDAKAVQAGDVMASDETEIKLRDIQIRRRMGKSGDGQDDAMIYLRIFLDMDNKKDKDVKLNRLLSITASADGQECKESLILVNGSKEEKVPAGVSHVEYGIKVPKDSRSYEISFQAAGQSYKMGFQRGDSIPGQQEVPMGEDFLYGGSSVKLENLEIDDKVDLGKKLSATSGYSAYISLKPSREGSRILHVSGMMKNESGTDWDKDYEGWGQMLLTAAGDVYYGEMVDNGADPFQIAAGEEKEFHILFDVPENLDTDGLQMMLYENNVYTYVDRPAFSEKLNQFLAAPDGTVIASAGEVEGNTYTNPYLGLTMEAPDGWELYGPDEIAAVTDNESGMKDNQEDWDIGYLFYMRNPAGEMGIIQAEAIPLRMLADSSTAEEFVTAYIESSAFLGGIMNSTKYSPEARESQEISGHLAVFTEGSTTYSQHIPPFNTITYRAGYGAFVEKGYVIMIETAAMDDQDQAAAMAAVKSMRLYR